MPRIVRDINITSSHDRYKLPLHKGAQFLGLGVLSELHTDFAVSWWLDDLSAPEDPVTVWRCLSGDPLPDGVSVYHLGSYLDNNSQPVRYFKGAHLFRVTGPPARCSRPT